MKVKILLIASVIILLLTTETYADSLPLSNAEIKKLRTYFPVQRDTESYQLQNADL